MPEMRNVIRLIQIAPLLIILFACAGSDIPITPEMPSDTSSHPEIPSTSGITISESVILTSRNSDFTTWQGVFGAAEVYINPDTLEGEIIPSRQALAVGDVFDADLTQFLRVSPCHNCLQLGQMNINEAGNILVQFRIRHPFRDIERRPDLHGFDVRGIAIAPGSTEFPRTRVTLPDDSSVQAKGNVDLVVNADGYTSHFDSLAENEFYFVTPRNYEGNINPFKRFAVDSSRETFDPMNPRGYNVFAVGSNWYSAIYELKPPQTGNINFVIVVDMAYGQSAVLANRQDPKYYLPWFNRKEAWKLDVEITENNLYAGAPQSSAHIQVQVCDWQAGIEPNPNYPESPLSSIPEKSDVKRVTVDIPNVMSAIETKSSPESGTGIAADPYIFNFTVKNNLGAPAGVYKGIVACRDDLDGTQGPIGIPEGPDGFPPEGEDLLDYSVYQIFSIEIEGAPNQDPIIDTDPYSSQNPAFEKTIVQFNVEAHDPDGDPLEYFWQQISPTEPEAIFHNTKVKSPYVLLPEVPENTIFTFTVTISDGRGGIAVGNLELFVRHVNRPPEITFGPFFWPLRIKEGEYVDIELQAVDPDGDPLTFTWFQVEPAYPVGEFDDPAAREPRWTAPSVTYDTMFRLRVIVSDNQLSATAQIDVPVGAINNPPFGEIIPSKDPPVYDIGENVILQAEFDDPDGNLIVSYEWDLDYDGVTFTPSGHTGASLNTTFDDPEVRIIACRATDDGDPAMSGIEAIEIVIKGKEGSNVAVSDIAPPASMISSNTNQNATARIDDTLYVLFESINGGNREFRVVKSYNSGLNFEPSVVAISKADTVPMEFPSIAAHDNYVWVAWSDDNDVRLVRSTDNGDSFESEISLGTLADDPDHMPSMAYNSSSNELFIAYADNDGSGNGIINLQVSDDFGQSFSHTGSYVTSDIAPTSSANIALAPNGRLYVSWIDERNTAAGDVYFASSIDGGATFGINHQVNLDYSGNGVEYLTMTTGYGNEAFFSWRDNRSGTWRLYFAATVGNGSGVLGNANITPVMTNIPEYPKLYVNSYGKVYVVFGAYTGSSNKTYLSIADYPGGSFTFVPLEINDVTTSTSNWIFCDVSGRPMQNGFADDLFIVWTDYRNGENGYFGDVFGQKYLSNSY